jgi:hypothetical protein
VSAEKALHDKCQGLLQLTGPHKNLLSLHFSITYASPLSFPNMGIGGGIDMGKTANYTGNIGGDVRKLAVFIVIAFTLFGCSDSPFYHTAINDSSETVVAYFYSGTDAITLLPGETVEFELEKGTGGEYGLLYYFPKRTVNASYNSSSGKCVFEDRASYEVKIINMSALEGTLEVFGDWMEPIDFTDDTDEQSDPEWLIYTSSPIFTAVAADGFNLITSYVKTEDSITVTIR